MKFPVSGAHYNSLSGKELDGLIAFWKATEGLWAFVDLWVCESNINKLLIIRFLA